MNKIVSGLHNYNYFEEDRFWNPDNPNPGNPVDTESLGLEGRQKIYSVSPGSWQQMAYEYFSHLPDIYDYKTQNGSIPFSSTAVFLNRSNFKMCGL